MLTGNIDPFFLAFLRFFISGLILVCIDRKKITAIQKKDWFFLSGLGILGITVALGSFHASLKGLNASTGAVIFSMNPLFSTLFAVFFLKETMNLRKAGGVLTGFLGVYIVCFGMNPPEITGMKYILLMLTAAIGFGTYIAATKPFIKKYGTFFTTGTVFITGSLPYLLFIKSYSVTEISTSLPVLLYLSLITTGLAYCLYFYGLKRVPLIAGTSMFYLKPVLATLFAIVLLNEKPSFHFYAGIIIILTGMFLAMNPAGKKTKS